MAAGEEKSNDFYAVLGLKKECTASELRNAYKRLALVRIVNPFFSSRFSLLGLFMIWSTGSSPKPKTIRKNLSFPGNNRMGFWVFPKNEFFFLSGFSRENMGFSRKFCNFLNLDGKLFLVDVAPRSLLLVGKLEIRGRSEEEISGHTRSLFRLFQSLIFYFFSNYLSKIILLIPEGKNKNRKGKKITTFLY